MKRQNERDKAGAALRLGEKKREATAQRKDAKLRGETSPAAARFLNKKPK